MINVGSINIDYVYQVDHQVRPGETLAAESYQVFPGGKGLNQSIALAKAGVEVTHVGKIGKDGLWLKQVLHEKGVDTARVQTSAQATGHAMIQVSHSGENAIIIHGGANRDLDSSLITAAISQASDNDFLLLQNETNAVPDIINAGSERGLTLMFNPAPMDDGVLSYPLEKIDWFIVNETEGEALTGRQRSDEILNVIQQRFPRSKTVLTLGSKGLMYADSSHQTIVPAYKIDAVDTTGTGDTFIGFFLAAIARGKELETALREASAASAVCAKCHGASSSIPDLEEVKQFLLHV